MDKRIIMKKAISDALERILEKSDSFQSVTVQNILDECGLSRPTFYRYFSDKYDVVNWSYTYYVEELSGLYSGAASDNNMMKNFIQFFYDKRTFFSKVMDYVGQNSFFEHYNAGLTRWYTTLHSKNMNELTAEEKYTLSYCAAGTSEVLQQWLSKGCQDPPELIFKILKKFDTFQA